MNVLTIIIIVVVVVFVVLMGVLLLMGPFIFSVLTLGLVLIGHETFYTAIFLAFIIAACAYFFAYLISKNGKRRNLIITAGIITFIISLGSLGYAYQWEISDVLAKSCKTCTDFSTGNRYTYQYPDGNGRSYSATAEVDRCIVWDSSWATARCLYPSALPGMGLASVLLAVATMALTGWYTQEINVIVRKSKYDLTD